MFGPMQRRVGSGVEHGALGSRAGDDDRLDASQGQQIAQIGLEEFVWTGFDDRVAGRRRDLGLDVAGSSIRAEAVDDQHAGGARLVQQFLDFRDRGEAARLGRLVARPARSLLVAVEIEQ